MTEAAATQELVLERVFDAPRQLVYRAFTDPEMLAKWFGPVGWSVPRHTIDMDVRTGGHERLVMVNDQDPNQTSPVDATFSEVVENELLVGYEIVGEEFGVPSGTRLEMRLEFREENGKTRLLLRQGPYAAFMAAGAREGWTTSFTKLDALLAAA
jgi:uncharacterized protein YndB with AHSA1/START domain